jgi:four helix bundle protein
MEEFGYRNLIVWQKAMALIELVYDEIKKFPQEERFALSDQLRRSVVSIPSNIAEGNGRSTNKDYAHFLSIARGSLYETLTQLEIAQKLGYVSNIEGVESVATEVGRMLGAMLKKYGTIQEK